MRHDAREQRGEAAPARESPVDAAAPDLVVMLQQSAGNAAVSRLLARDADTGYEFSDDPLATMPRPSWIPTPGPIRTTLIRPREKPIDWYVEQAKARSPTAKRHIERAFKLGYGFAFSRVGGTDISTAGQVVSINPTNLSDEQILVRLMYESGNVVNMDLFDDVRRRNEALEYKSADAFARAMLGAESTTAVYASIKALEAGLTYSTFVDPLVKAATKPDPTESGRLVWKSDKERDRVFAQVEEHAFKHAQAQDASGAWIPARELYGRRWLYH